MLYLRKNHIYMRFEQTMSVCWFWSDSTPSPSRIFITVHFKNHNIFGIEPFPSASLLFVAHLWPKWGRVLRSLDFL